MGVLSSMPVAVAPTPQSKSNTTPKLLSIPPELRLKIYKKILEPKDITSRQDGSDIVKAEIKEPALLAICSLIREEAEAIFYNSLKLVINRNNLFEPIRDSIHNLDQIPESQFQQIRHFAIPFARKITINITLTKISKQNPHPEALHRGLATAPGLYILTSSPHPLCTNSICNAMAHSVRDFLLCLIVHRAQTKICADIGPCRAIKMKASAIERETKKKRVQLRFLQKREVEWLLEHLRFEGKQILREGALLGL